MSVVRIEGNGSHSCEGCYYDKGKNGPCPDPDKDKRGACVEAEDVYYIFVEEETECQDI